MTERPKETRRVLLDAAAEEFARLGAQGARIQAIVKRSGVNERMIYHHFGSKDGLYRAVLADQWTGAADDWQQALARAVRLEPREGLEVAFGALFDRMAARPLMMLLAVHESMSGWKLLPQATLAQVPAEMQTLFARGRRKGVFREDCTFETLYLTLMGALSSLIVVAPRFSDLRKQVREDPTSSRRMAEQIIALVLDGAGRTARQGNRNKSRRRRK